MPKVARLTDLWQGICCCHPPIPCIPMSGPIITASPNHESSNLRVARLNDTTIGWCGHTGTIVTASTTSITNNRGKARVTDAVTGCNIGNIITGDPRYVIDCGEAPYQPVPPHTVEHTDEEGVTREITYTEVDFGNVDDEATVVDSTTVIINDDGLNNYPPIIGREPTPAEITHSNNIDVSPTNTLQTDSTADIVVLDATAVQVLCINVSDDPPDNLQLSPNFTLGELSTQAAVSHYKVRAQVGLTVQDIVCNLQAWAQNIGETLSAKYGRKNILVTSGFRIGTGRSQHNRGQAADLQFPGWTHKQYYDAAVWIRDNVQYDQLILEYGGRNPWIHVSFNRDGNRPSTHPAKYGTRISPGNYVWREIRYME